MATATSDAMLDDSAGAMPLLSYIDVLVCRSGWYDQLDRGIRHRGLNSIRWVSFAMVVASHHMGVPNAALYVANFFSGEITRMNDDKIVFQLGFPTMLIFVHLSSCLAAYALYGNGAFFSHAFYGIPNPYTLLPAQSILWYLSALFGIRTVLPYMLKYRSTAMTVLCLLALTVVYCTNYEYGWCSVYFIIPSMYIGFTMPILHPTVAIAFHLVNVNVDLWRLYPLWINASISLWTQLPGPPNFNGGGIAFVLADLFAMVSSLSSESMNHKTVTMMMGLLCLCPEIERVCRSLIGRISAASQKLLSCIA